jgi:hypothetical protein
LRTRRISNSAAIGFGIEHNFQVITDRIEHRIGEREMFYRSDPSPELLRLAHKRTAYAVVPVLLIRAIPQTRSTALL